MTLPYDLGVTGRTASAFLLLYCAAEVAFAVFSFTLFNFYDRLDAGTMNQREMDAAVVQVDTTGAAVGALFLLALLAAHIVAGMWLYRAAANAQAVKPNDARITPGWSVGWYFVPFANLLMPYRAMRQTWNGLRGNDSLDAGLPGWALIWWVFWLVGNTLSTVSLRINTSAASIDDFRLSTTLDVMSSGFSIIAALLFRNLILTLTRASAEAVPHTLSATPTPQGG